MTDLEMTRLCAEAMNLTHEWDSDAVFLGIGHGHIPSVRYDPLNDDAQAMALVKKFWMIIRGERLPQEEDAFWRAMMPGAPTYSTKSQDLNRAVCECVAKMRAAKK